MLKIGLTGGIGSGKTKAAEYFSKLKVPIIDADKIAHELLKPDTKLHKKVISHFGKDFLTSKNTLNRKKLRNLIFSNKKERLWLEKLLHPAIQKEINKKAKKLKSPYCIIAVPLLFETKFPIKIDRALVIDCWKKDQINRIRKRDKSSINQAKSIIKTQIDRKLRLKKADDAIKNTSTIDNLKKSVKNLHLYYLSLS